MPLVGRCRANTLLLLGSPAPVVWVCPPTELLLRSSRVRSCTETLGRPTPGARGVARASPRDARCERGECAANSSGDACRPLGKFRCAARSLRPRPPTRVAA
jgi:hypothetical protein